MIELLYCIPIGNQSTTTTSKNNRLHEQKQQLCTCIKLFATFLWRPLMEDLNIHGRIFFFSFFQVLKNSTPGKLVYIWQLSGYNSRALAAVCRHFFFISCASHQADLDEEYSPKMLFLFNCKLYLKWSKFLCSFTAWVRIKTTCIETTGFQSVAACKVIQDSLGFWIPVFRYWVSDSNH